ncbi:MAG TPA: hypothetical protein VKY74_07955 [Chloroflexia bacterium]|nr:hypothetical protein [Chloroflexia bacterium]
MTQGVSDRPPADIHPYPPDGPPTGAPGAPAGPAARPPGPDSPRAGAPTISPAEFARVLQQHRSPVLQEATADAYYQTIQAAGIDPAVALAAFEQASAYGTARPDALRRAKNWGGLRVGPEGNLGRATHPVRTRKAGTFRGYEHWMDSLRDWCDLLPATPPAPAPDTGTPAPATGVRDLAAAAAAPDLAPAADTAARDLAPAGATAMPALGQHVGWNDRPHGPEFPFKSTPTISPAVFTGVLQAYNSPALLQVAALDLYRAPLGVGINPAVALAFFEHESQCGTGTAQDSPVAAAGANNWGNLRTSRGRAIGTVTVARYGSFAKYRNYLDSLLDWCDLINANFGNMTIRQALQIYAPRSDGNDPDGYATRVQLRIAKWDNDSGAFDIPGTSPPGPPDPNQDITPNYRLLGPPTIGVERFIQVLTDAASPTIIEASGDIYYTLAATNGVDPMVALAFFGQESNYGTDPGAADRKNWGNLWDAHANAFGTYPSWVDGLRDWCARLQGPAYTAQGTPTIGSIVPIYQPAGARQNGNAWYINQICDRIRQLRGN